MKFEIGKAYVYTNDISSTEVCFASGQLTNNGNKKNIFFDNIVVSENCIVSRARQASMFDTSLKEISLDEYGRIAEFFFTNCARIARVIQDIPSRHIESIEKRQSVKAFDTIYRDIRVHKRSEEDYLIECESICAGACGVVVKHQVFPQYLANRNVVGYGLIDEAEADKVFRMYEMFKATLLKRITMSCK